MALSKLYSRINWKNYPSEESPMNETNLNRMDAALDAVDNRVIEQDATKANKTDISNLVSNWILDEETGIITITKYDGSQVLFDLNIEKIPVGFSLSEDGILTMTTEDGTEFTADIGSMIPVLTFQDSDTIAVTVTGSGENKTYSFSVKSGSITADKLQPDYLAEVQTAAGRASGAAASALQSESAVAASAASALASKKAAAASEKNAADSAASALESKEASQSSATSASGSAVEAQTSATAAGASASSASNSAAAAQTSKEASAASEGNAQRYSALTEQNASTATDKATLAKSFAEGGTGTRPGEDADNAKYYMEQAKAQTGGIPTKLSQLQNDAGYITAAVDNLINYYKSSQLYTKTEVDNKLSSIPKFEVQVVEALPTENISGTTLYLLKESDTGTNKCSEWIYVDGAWESIGSLDVDMSDYLKTNGDGSNLTEVFTQASSVANIASGESHKTIFGKIMKVIADYITHKTTAATASTLGHVKVDSAISSTSTNPVQNKAVNAALSAKMASTGDASQTTVTFTEATAMTELVSGEKQSTLFGKLKLTVKNVIAILNLLGSTDITGFGDGTVTGAIENLNSYTSSWTAGTSFNTLGDFVNRVCESKAMTLYGKFKTSDSSWLPTGQTWNHFFAVAQNPVGSEFSVGINGVMWASNSHVPYFFQITGQGSYEMTYGKYYSTEEVDAIVSEINSNLSCTKEFSGSVTIAKSGTATITLPLESYYSYFLIIRGVDNVAWNGAYIIHTGKTSKTMVTLSATYNVTATLSNTTLTIKNGDVTYSQELAVELLKL